MPDEELHNEQLVFFDTLAELSREPDKRFETLRDLYESDERLNVPTLIFNALRNQTEPMLA